MFWYIIRERWTFLSSFFHQTLLKRISLVAQWLRLCTPNGGDLNSIPGQGTRSHMHKKKKKKKVCMLQQRSKIRSATTKIQHRQRNEEGFPVAQWLGVRLPMQETQAQSLSQEDPTCHRACAPQLLSLCSRAHALQQEKPLELKSIPNSPQLEKNSCSNKDPAESINKFIKEKEN